jgi:uncharacterized protein (DUF885 family)
MALALAACARDPSPADLAPFREFLKRTYAEEMALYPSTATRRGIRDHDDAWNPVSEAFRDRIRERNKKLLLQLQLFDNADLTPGERLSRQLLILKLERDLTSDDFRRQKYAIHSYRGAHTQIPAFLISIHQVKELAHAESYIGRLRNIGPLFDEVIEQMRLDEEAGIFLPDWSYPKIIEASRNVITGAPFDSSEDSTLLADFRAKVQALDLDEASRSRLITQATAALVEVVEPAYRRLIAEAERMASHAPAQDGVWKHPAGDDFYAERIRYFTTTNLTPAEVHEIGLREVARVHEEMRGIMQAVGFEGDLRGFMEFMRTDSRFYYANDAAGRDRYMREAKALIDTMRDRLPEVFGLFPRSELVVKQVEAFRERSAGKAFYQAPPPDGSRPGIYYANLYDMGSMPAYQMEALAYHEGIPGHHMQRAISIESNDVPEFQKYATFTAYTEGWGLYSELLPKEMGFYTDPYSDFGRLAMELWRAARLVVDTGLHYKRWSREEAIAYLVENTPNSEYDATRAIERYNLMPGQATAYMIGKLRILELRESARARLGDDFDIAGFHDEILKDGPVPLSILEEKIEKWAQGIKSGK